MKHYTIYVGDDCHQCNEVVSFLKENDISFREVNVDTMDEEPPFQLFAFPALFENKTLLRYGSDINQFFKSKT